jgi:Zn-dependent protease with chaperone function
LEQEISINNYLKNFRVIRNLLVAYIFAIGFNIILFITLTNCINYFIKSSHPEREEFLWQMINSSLPEDDDNEENNFYYLLYADYIQELVNKLPNEIMPPRYSKIQIHIVNDYSVNAFAAPSGKIILTKGLLNNIRSENGLMFVIGHEIGHFHSDDHLYEFSRSLSSSIVSILSFAGDLEMIDFIMMIDNHSTKKSENKADIWGLKTIITIYGHAGGSKEFFEILLDLGVDGDDGLFSTHPPTLERMKTINKVIKRNKLPELTTIALE